jgi:hypothetical protein
MPPSWRRLQKCRAANPAANPTISIAKASSQQANGVPIAGPEELAGDSAPAGETTAGVTTGGSTTLLGGGSAAFGATGGFSTGFGAGAGFGFSTGFGASTGFGFSTGLGFSTGFGFSTAFGTTGAGTGSVTGLSVAGRLVGSGVWADATNGKPHIAPTSTHCIQRILMLAP